MGVAKDCQSCGNDAENLDQEFLAIIGGSPRFSRPVSDLAKDADGEPEQTVVLTKKIVQMILNGTNHPSASQIPILGMSGNQVSNWPKELEGRIVDVCDLIELAIRRPSVPKSGKSKTYYREQKKLQTKTQCQRKPPKHASCDPPAVEDGLTYASRDRVLASLGYATYSAYLKSETWTYAKMKAFHEKGSNCMWCNKPAATAHHSCYDLSTMKGVRTRHLWPICNGCHNQAELRRGKKTSLMEANARLGIKSDGTLCLKSRKRVVGIDKAIQQASKGCNIQNLHHANHGRRRRNKQSPSKTA